MTSYDLFFGHSFNDEDLVYRTISDIFYNTTSVINLGKFPVKEKYFNVPEMAERLGILITNQIDSDYTIAFYHGDKTATVVDNRKLL